MRLELFKKGECECELSVRLLFLTIVNIIIIISCDFYSTDIIFFLISALQFRKKPNWVV